MEEEKVISSNIQTQKIFNVQLLSLTSKKCLLGLPWWRSGGESACQCRGHGFEPWSGKIPHAAEQLGPWGTTTEPARLEPVLRNRRGRDGGRPAHRDEERPPLATTGESPHTETKTQKQPKKKSLLYFKSTFHFVQILNISYITSVYQDILGVGWVGVGVGERVGITPTMNLDEKWMKGDSRRETALLIPSPMLIEKEESSKFTISISWLF